MKLTKEDFMRLPKERLAELLVEMQNEPKVEFVPPIFPSYLHDSIPCYAPNGICTNPQHDCINCPKLQGTGGYQTVTKLNTGEK